MKNMSFYSEAVEFFSQESIEYFAPLKREHLCLADGKTLDESVKSAFVFLMPYYTRPYPDRNVSLYSVCLDYHSYIKELSCRFERKLAQKNATFSFRFMSDASPVSEVVTAARAGLGVMGQNRLLINEKYGSFVFVGTLLTDEVFEEECYVLPKDEDNCIGCGKCKDACAFLRGERDFCLSELNQRKNVTDDELAVITSAPLCWGCDDCQIVCPMNSNVPSTPIEFFKREPLDVLTYEAVKAMPKTEFSKRAYSWRGKRVILRNLGEDSE